MLFFAAINMMAVPAKSGAITVTQPDGTTVTVSLHGDEWLNYETTSDGYTIVRNDKGYYVYAELQQGKLVPTTVIAHDSQARNVQEKQYLSATQKYLKPQMDAKIAQMRELIQVQQKQTLAKRRQMRKAGMLKDTGTEPNYKSLVILVQFNDKSFSRSDYGELMTDMINKENYTGYQEGSTFVSCTGSVRDYFTDNSGGVFRPQFDVYGPYTVDYSQYAPQQASNTLPILLAALDKADADVDFSQYDNDGDGFVDNVYFIIAGYGSNYSGNDSRLWWPYRSAIYNPDGTTYYDYYIKKDGIYLWDFASSVELYGWTSVPATVHIDGIGTFCHEFSHVQGLPDFYDTDYGASGGQSTNTPGGWSVMASGSYENDGRTPVGYSYYERCYLGYAEENVISTAGSYTLEPVHTSNNGFILPSGNPDERFFLDNRQNVKWNTTLPGHGMIVYREDKSSEEPWNHNQINANPSHNYLELLRAGGGTTDSGSDPFPGTDNVKVLNNVTSPANLIAWAGQEAPYGLKNINEENGIITFDVESAMEVSSISLPEKIELSPGWSCQLKAVVEPSYAPYTLTWESKNPEIATVTKEGLVEGVSIGTTTVTVTTDNGLDATTTVIVSQLDEAENIATFKTYDENHEALLDLNDVIVNYINGSDAYVSDATGAIILRDMPFTLSVNSVLNGMIFVKYTRDGEMPVAEAVADQTTDDNIQITAGTAEPKNMKLADLTPDDYGQYIIVENVEMILEMENGQSYAMLKDGDTQIFINNKFKITFSKLPSSLESYRFTLTGIYGTRKASVNSVTYDDIYPTAKWTQKKLAKYTVGFEVGEGGKLFINDEETAGTGSKTYYEGTLVSMSVISDENYELESVLIDDADVTKQFADGAIYTIESIDASHNLTVTFKEKEIVDGISRLTAAHAGERVLVYSIDGRVVAETTVGSSGAITLPVNFSKPGLYVVKVGNMVFKVKR